ncbi:NADH-ubiquinone/plastoquinone oxidoreductase, chain 6 [Novosphingobium nitrogenifigens DSM 19370]|uniref:NADH-quinone oxidoreductase subunit J n=1 Tax=Novosphingobium nitrogenifigens DSM 19370 TaxID=983920 RepID=F1Z964_9SPHN|nr:NADH-quinone oxidoreductase subunit J [Novosphingobium nitrogenifigens]EGD58916.1 NADH-ubiquinone/plastoquinone oxidoreductase, chain 6 [Novosphingobium nitrogenifigens DSM 19370]
MIQAFAFYLFATLMIVSGAVTILARNPVHSVLWLILAFFNAAGLMVLAGAEFIAMLLIIVYVGAVAVLFLFVVMMLDIDFAELRAGFIRNAPLGVILAVVLFVELFVGILVRSAGDMAIGTAGAATAVPAGLSNTAAIGALLYTRYLFVFEAAGFILLVAMIGAIVLTHRQRSGVRGQNIAKQIARRPEEATINLQPEVGKGVSL